MFYPIYVTGDIRVMQRQRTGFMRDVMSEGKAGDLVRRGQPSRRQDEHQKEKRGRIDNVPFSLLPQQASRACPDPG